MSVTREQLDKKVMDAIEEAMDSNIKLFDIIATLESAKLSMAIFLARKPPK